MTPEYMLDKLVKAGEKMRNAQEHYGAFHSLRSSDVKKNARAAKKQAEQEFDNAIFNIKQFLK